jgi:hypothetical protein
MRTVHSQVRSRSVVGRDRLTQFSAESASKPSELVPSDFDRGVALFTMSRCRQSGRASGPEVRLRRPEAPTTLSSNDQWSRFSLPGGVLGLPLLSSLET